MKKTFTTALLLGTIMMAKAQNWVEQGTAPANAIKIEVSDKDEVYVLTPPYTFANPIIKDPISIDPIITPQKRTGASDEAIQAEKPIEPLPDPIPTPQLNIYKMNSVSKAFSLLPGGGIASDIECSAGKIYAVGLPTNIYEYNTNSLTWSLHSTVTCNDVTYDGEYLMITNTAINFPATNFSYKLKTTATWTTFDFRGWLTAIERGTDKSIFGYNTNNASWSGMFNQNTRKWEEISSTIPLKSISVYDMDNAWAVSTDNKIYKYNKVDKRWDAKNGSAISISISNNKLVWVLGTDGKIYNAPANELTSSEQENSEASNKAVYPNPANSFIHTAGAAKVYDMFGNLVAEGIDLINIENLSNGCYMVKTGNTASKLIKQ
jgi:hypothetical protein